MIKIRHNTFVRNAGDESVVWCPRTGGCTVMRNAQPILEEMKREWRDVEDIVRAVGTKFECAVDEVREGVEAVVGELVGQSQLFVPKDVSWGDHLFSMKDGKYAVDVTDGLIDYTIGRTDDLPNEPFAVRRRIEITFQRHDRSHVGIGAQRSDGIANLGAPTLGVLLGKFARDGAQNSSQLVACCLGPVVFQGLNPDSISFSKESKSSSSSMKSPFSKSRRDASIMWLNAARLRQVSSSSHVLSKSATLIITLVLRPFCVITIGRCVRDVLAKQSLRVRRYSVKGTTSSSRRGRSMLLALVRIVWSPFENYDIVHYPVPEVNGMSVHR